MELQLGAASDQGSRAAQLRVAWRKESVGTIQYYQRIYQAESLARKNKE